MTNSTVEIRDRDDMADCFPKTCEEFFQAIRARAAMDNAHVIELLEPPYRVDLNGMTSQRPILVIAAGGPIKVNAFGIAAPGILVAGWRDGYAPQSLGFGVEQLLETDLYLRAMSHKARRPGLLWRKCPKLLKWLGFSHPVRSRDFLDLRQSTIMGGISHKAKAEGSR